MVPRIHRSQEFLGDLDESTDRLELVGFVVEVEVVLEVALRRAREFVLIT